MSETPPKIVDRDFVIPPTAESMMKEDEELRQAYARGDYATFSLWLQKQERELTEHPDPVEHANVLVRAARILNAANAPDGAVQLLLRAAQMVRGVDARTEEGVVMLLQQIGGEAAVGQLAETLRQQKAQADAEAMLSLSEQNAQVQRELIDIQKHDFNIAERFGPGADGVRKRDDRVAELKQQLQELTQKRAALMNQSTS